MRKTTLVIIALLLFSTFSVVISQVETQWTKYSFNPVLTEARNQVVIKDNGVYKMWYQTQEPWSSTICFASSTDGIHWTEYSGNPVLSQGPPSSWDYRMVMQPFVIKEDGIYKMWYGGDNGTHTNGIGLATSTDGLHWVKYENNPVLKLGDGGEWDDHVVNSPMVIKDNGIYRMWYSGHSVFPLSYSRIGFANSTDGIHWTKYPGNPVMDKGSPGDFDARQLGDPYVIKEDGTYKMWYTGIDDPIGTHRIGYATSNDGITWNKFSGNPVLDINVSNYWENDHVSHPCVINDNGLYKMWYTSSGGVDVYYINFASAVAPTISATVDIDPNTLNLRSNGEFVTAYIELPEGYNVTDIDLLTVQLEGIPAITDTQYGFVTDPASYLMDHDEDGILERMVKFDRDTVRDTLTGMIDYEEGVKFYNLTLTVTGKLVDGTPFEGTDTIVVIRK